MTTNLTESYQHDLVESLEDSRIFKEKLKTLHEINVELSKAGTLEAIYQGAVIHGRERLGFDRLGLLLTGENGRGMYGTFGTDEHGNVRDERDYYEEELSEPILGVLHNRERVHVWRETVIHDLGQRVGIGWNVMAALWDGDRSIGWLAIDNLIQKLPLKEYQIDLLSLYAQVVAQLITRKKSETSLKSSEALFKGVFDNAADGIILVDSDWQILRLNRSAGNLLKINEEDQASFCLEQFFPENAIETLTEGSQSINIRDQDGRIFPSEVVISALNQDAQQVYILHIQDVSHRDITEKITEEKEMFRTELEKERELGELKTRFISMVSHEFRTPLATIKATINNLQRYSDQMLTADRNERYTNIHQQISRMTNMIDDVLFIGRFDRNVIPLNLSNEHLDSTIKALVEDYGLIIQNTHPIEYQCLPEAMHQIVSIDVDLMRQVIENLLSNAAKYSPQNTPIEVSVAIQDNQAVISVGDAGIGIPKKDIPRLFEPFHRASNVGTTPGTGLGLAIVNRAINLHHGTVKVESVVNQGTTFTIKIPLKY